MKKFSIVTVCRNEEAAIRDTCESIVSQHYQNFEWIVIDGASSDGTLEILSEYRNEIQHLVSEPDNGIYNAMNKGAISAMGEYLIFMNGGDRFADSDALLFAAQSPRAQMLYGDVYLGSQTRNIETYPDVVDSGYMLRNMIPHQATFYERATFEAVGGYDESFKIAADYDLYIRLFEDARVSHYHIPYPIAVFDLEGISNNRKFRQLRKRENHRIRKQYFKTYRYSLKCLRQEIRNFCANRR